MKHGWFGRWIGLLTIAGLAAGCRDAPPAPGPAKEAKGRSVILGYSAPKLIGGQAAIHHGLERQAKEKGWQIITTTSDGDPDRQVTQIQSFIALGVSAIVAVPEDSRKICAAAEAARAARVPFYAIDRAPEGCRINMTVLSDNQLAGRQSGEAMVALLKERHGAARGVVLEVAGNMAQNVAQLRARGFQEALRPYPEIRVITRSTDWDKKQGEALVGEVLAATPDLDGVYLHSDAVYMDGTLAALRGAGRLHRRGEAGHVFITAVDGYIPGARAIREGYADQSSNQPTPDFGRVVDWVEMELKGQTIAAAEVTREGALWSPARVTQSEIGPLLTLSTTSITAANVEDPRIWANQPGAARP